MSCPCRHCQTRPAEPIFGRPDDDAPICRPCRVWSDFAAAAVRGGWWCYVLLTGPPDAIGETVAAFCRVCVCSIIDRRHSPYASHETHRLQICPVENKAEPALDALGDAVFQLAAFADRFGVSVQLLAEHAEGAHVAGRPTPGIVRHFYPVLIFNDAGTVWCPHPHVSE
jgi:hypothetical protein